VFFKNNPKQDSSYANEGILVLVYLLKNGYN